MTPRFYIVSVRLLALWGAIKLSVAANRTLPKPLWRRWYDDLSELTDLIFGELPFMNYGLDGPALALAPEDEPHRFQIQMVHEVATSAGRAPLRGLRVLEVGCGRGGGASYVARTLEPAFVDALDLSAAAVASCARRYAAVPRLRFRQGDAERLPFDDGSFDVVLNIETSHCYADFPAFLAEVTRVLVPGGRLHLADFRRPERVDAWLADMDASGLRRTETDALTPRVVAALDRDDARKRDAIRRSGVPPFLENAFRQFTGCRGSAIYENFAADRRVYLRLVLEKAGTARPSR